MVNVPVQQIAKLSNLSLSNADLEKLGNQLDQTIDYVRNLQELDISKVKPTSSLEGNLNVFFEDGARNSRTLHPKVYTVSRIL